MRWLSLASVFVVLCGALAGWQVGGLGIAMDTASIRADSYRLLRSEAEPYELTPSRWLLEPHRYADFDLYMTVELGEHTALDVLVRQVEPRLVDSELLPFHGRFSVLRLSTQSAGPALLARSAALFGDRMAGHELAPGIAATVWLQARGRLLRANVAGTWLPWFATDDDYGMLTLIARGGTAVLRHLVIEPRPRAQAWLQHRGMWSALGAGAGLLVLAAALALGSVVRRLAIARLLAAGALLAVALTVVCNGIQVLPLATARPGAQLALLAAWLVIALAVVAWPPRMTATQGPIAAAVVLAIAALLHSGAVRTLRGAGEEATAAVPALDAVFGPAAGNVLAESLAQRVRGPYGVHTVGGRSHGASAATDAPRRVFLLGGQLLYGRVFDERSKPDEPLEVLLTGALRGALGERIDVPCLPTVDGYSGQQWRLFAEFFRGYEPAAIVFGVARDESALDPHTRAPRSNPDALRSTLRQLCDYAANHQVALVLFAEEEVPAELMAVLQEMHEGRSPGARAPKGDRVPLLIARADQTPAQLANNLLAVLVPLLRR